MAMTRTRKAIVTGAAAVGVVLGAAGITAAATSSGSSSTSKVAPDAADAADGPESYASSITAAKDANPDGLATITADEASAAAVSATGGTAGKVELENENGNVVYGVEITAPDGNQLDVKVDAGNASVLAKESDNDHESADSENGGKDAEANDSSETAD
jgi:uncharacterized membrane protein YkoI